MSPALQSNYTWLTSAGGDWNTVASLSYITLLDHVTQLVGAFTALNEETDAARKATGPLNIRFGIFFSRSFWDYFSGSAFT